MSQAAAIKLTVPPQPKRGAAGKFLLGLLILTVAFAGFYYWRHFNSRPVPETRAKPASPANAKTDNHLTVAKTGNAVASANSAKTAQSVIIKNTDNKPAEKAGEFTAVKTAVAGFANSLITAFSPSAKAATVHSDVLPQPKPAVEAMPVAQALPAKRQSLISAVPPRPAPPLTPEQKRLQVAQDGFGNVMDRAADHPDTYGFLPDEELGNATLGPEIPVYTIKLAGHDKSDPVNSLLQPANEWLFPVMLNNHVRYFVRVASDGSNFVLEDGSRGLAMNYDKILAQWPADKGFHPKLITVPGMPGYFFTIPELPDQNITDTSRILDFNPEVSPASIVLANCQ